MSNQFDGWLDELREDVIENDYGYEPGEFAVYPQLWRPMYERGLTPAQAFKAALDSHSEARRDEEAARSENWEPIQREDAEAVKRQREGTS